MPDFSSDFLRLLLLCSLPLFLILVALLIQWIKNWYVRHWNMLDAPIQRRLSYWHIAVSIVLLVPLVAIFALVISQPTSRYSLWLWIYLIASPILGVLFGILEYCKIYRHTKSQESRSESRARKGTKQDLQKLTAFAHSLLIQHNDRDEVIAHFCQATQWGQPEADAFVRRVEAIYNDAEPEPAKALAPKFLPRPHQPTGMRWTVLLLLLPLCAGAVFLTLRLFNLATGRDYWNDLSAEFIQGFLVPITLGFLLMLPVLLRKQTRQNAEPKLTQREAIGLLLLPVLLLIITVPHLLSVGYDLYVGPIHVKGVIEKTDYYRRRALWEYRYIFVQGTRYTVRDSDWFNTLKVGQEINFLCSPKTHYAYSLQ